MMNVTTTTPFVFCYKDKSLESGHTARINWIVIASFYITAGTLAVIFNLLFFITMKKNRKLHRLPNYLLATLSVVDFIIASVIMPGQAFILYARAQLVLFCDYSTFVSITGYCLATMSFITILSITIEQYIAIVHPFFHQKHITIKIILKIIIALWILLIIWCSVAWYIQDLWVIYQTFLGCFILACFIVMIYCYVSVFKIAKKTKQRINSNQRYRKNGIEAKRNNKAVKTSATIMVGFTTSYIPVGFLTLWRIIYGNGSTVFERTYIFEWALLFCAMNTMVNPLVYYWRLSDVRKTIRNEICRKKRRMLFSSRNNTVCAVVPLEATNDILVSLESNIAIVIPSLDKSV